MSILNIRKAVRAGSRVVIGICGPSGSGKTYTALKIGRGMVDSPDQIGFLDTGIKLGAYYGHERIWDRVSLGKMKQPEYSI